MPDASRWVSSPRARRASELTKKQLRHLAGLAYERELTKALAELETQFALWRAGELDSFALHEDVHRFHDGIARTLYRNYVTGFGPLVVADAIDRGVVSLADVAPDPVRESTRRMMATDAKTLGKLAK